MKKSRVKLVQSGIVETKETISIEYKITKVSHNRTWIDSRMGRLDLQQVIIAHHELLTWATRWRPTNLPSGYYGICVGCPGV